MREEIFDYTVFWHSPLEIVKEDVRCEKGEGGSMHCDGYHEKRNGKRLESNCFSFLSSFGVCFARHKKYY